MNPYQTPEPPVTVLSRRVSKRRLLGAGGLAMLGLLLVVPWFLLVGKNDANANGTGRRFATYDPELFFLGWEITPHVANLLALGVAPVCSFLAAFLVQRALKAGN